MFSRKCAPYSTHTTIMLVFQHTSTARWRAEDGTLEVVLYGRTAQGASVALRVSGCSAYGFISGAAVDAAFRRHVATLVQWLKGYDQLTESSVFSALLLLTSASAAQYRRQDSNLGRPP